MTYGETENALSGLKSRGMNFGVERTRKILDGLSKPDEKLKIIHIAGTNGKGSVAEYITKILIAAGEKVGTFTSPAVFDYYEQFKIDGKICKEEYLRAAEEVLKICGDATEFEVQTASALYAFASAGCAYAVVECGLGGTYDATNAILHKELAVITSISKEHTAILGNMLADICAHKAGIIKDCKCVVSGLNSDEVLSYFKALGAEIADKPYFGVKMEGYAQPYNAALAIAACKMLKIDETAIYSGVNRAYLGGRLQVLKGKDRTYILDGAHNPASFLPLSEYLKKLKGTKTIIYGCLSDKDNDGNLSALFGAAEEIYAVKPSSPRAMDLDKISSGCKKYFSRVCVAESLVQALESATGETVAVCGSFTLLGEAKKWIDKRL